MPVQYLYPTGLLGGVISEARHEKWVNDDGSDFTDTDAIDEGVSSNDSVAISYRADSISHRADLISGPILIDPEICTLRAKVAHGAGSADVYSFDWTFEGANDVAMFTGGFNTLEGLTDVNVGWDDVEETDENISNAGDHDFTGSILKINLLNLDGISSGEMIDAVEIELSGEFLQYNSGIPLYIAGPVPNSGDVPLYLKGCADKNIAIVPESRFVPNFTNLDNTVYDYHDEWRANYNWSGVFNLGFWDLEEGTGNDIVYDRLNVKSGVYFAQDSNSTYDTLPWKDDYSALDGTYQYHQTNHGVSPDLVTGNGHILFDSGLVYNKNFTVFGSFFATQAEPYTIFMESSGDATSENIVLEYTSTKGMQLEWIDTSGNSHLVTPGSGIDNIGSFVNWAITYDDPTMTLYFRDYTMSHHHMYIGTEDAERAQDHTLRLSLENSIIGEFGIKDSAMSSGQIQELFHATYPSGGILHDGDSNTYYDLTVPITASGERNSCQAVWFLNDQGDHFLEMGGSGLDLILELDNVTDSPSGCDIYVSLGYLYHHVSPELGADYVNTRWWWSDRINVPSGLNQTVTATALLSGIPGLEGEVAEEFIYQSGTVSLRALYDHQDTEYINELKVKEMQLRGVGCFTPLPFPTGDLVVPLFTLGGVPFSGSMDLYTKAVGSGNASMDLYIAGPLPDSGTLTLFTRGHLSSNDNMPLYTEGNLPASGDVPLYARGHSPDSGNMPLYTMGPLPDNDSLDLHLLSTAPYSGLVDLYIAGPIPTNDNFTLHLLSALSASGDIPLYIYGGKSDYMPLYLKGPIPQTANDDMPLVTWGNTAGTSGIWDTTTLYIDGDIVGSGSLNLYIQGYQDPLTATNSLNLYLDVIGNADGSLGVDDNITLYVQNEYSGVNDAIDLFMYGPVGNSGWVPASGSLNLFINRQFESDDRMVPLYVAGPIDVSGMLDMYIQGGYSGLTGTMTTYIDGVGVEDNSLAIYTRGF